MLEELLVFKAKNGNEQAFEALFRIWNPKIFGFAYQFTQNKEVAKEITQETWLGVIKNLKSLKKESLFPIWVYRITQKKATDWMRQKYKYAEIVQKDFADENEEVFKEISKPDDLVSHIREEIAKLSRNHRVVLSLFYLENYDLEEISVILEIPKGTVKSRLHFAKEKFKQSIKANRKYHDEIF